MMKFKMLVLAMYMVLTMPAMGVDADCFYVMNSKPSVGVDCCVNNLADGTNNRNPGGELENCFRCDENGNVKNSSCHYLGIMYDESCSTKQVFSPGNVPTGAPRCCPSTTSTTDATTHVVSFLSCKNTMTDTPVWHNGGLQGGLWFIQRKTACDCQLQSYKCDIGYYGTPVLPSLLCTRCPALDSQNPNTYGTTAAIGAKDVTECFIPKNGTHKDSIGTYTFVENCKYTK